MPYKICINPQQAYEAYVQGYNETSLGLVVEAVPVYRGGQLCELLCIIAA